jgi:predicted DNA-binding ribbon-helix-helix protein
MSPNELPSNANPLTPGYGVSKLVSLRMPRKRAARGAAGQESSPKILDTKGASTMKSPIVKRSIVIAGHKTSVSLEDAFWVCLKDIAGMRNATLSDLVAAIDSERRHGNLSSAIRLFVLNHFRALSEISIAQPKNASETPELRTGS